MKEPILPYQLAICDLFRRLEIVVLLSVTAAEVATLSDEDVAAMRSLGATDGLLAALRAQAQAAPDDRIFALDFDAQTVTIETTLRGLDGHYVPSA